MIPSSINNSTFNLHSPFAPTELNLQPIDSNSKIEKEATPLQPDVEQKEQLALDDDLTKYSPKRIHKLANQCFEKKATYQKHLNQTLEALKVQRQVQSYEFDKIETLEAGYPFSRKKAAKMRVFSDQDVEVYGKIGDQKVFLFRLLKQVISKKAISEHFPNFINLTRWVGCSGFKGNSNTRYSYKRKRLRTTCGFGGGKTNQISLTWDSRKSFHKFIKSILFVRLLNHCFKEIYPQEYSKQEERACKGPHWLETSFTNYSFNVNTCTDLHRDYNDIWQNVQQNESSKQDLVVMTVFKNTIKKLSATSVEGTFFPEFGVGFDLEEGDVVIMNGEELHCNNHTFREPKVFGIKGKQNFLKESAKPYRAALILYRRAELENCKMIFEKIQNVEKSAPLPPIHFQFKRTELLQSATSDWEQIFPIISRTKLLKFRVFGCLDSSNCPQEDILRLIKENLQICGQYQKLYPFDSNTIIEKIVVKQISIDQSQEQVYEIQIQFNPGQTSNLNSCLYTIQLFGQTVLSDLFVVRDQSNVKDMISNSYKRDNKFLAQVQWYSQFCEFRKEFELNQSKLHDKKPTLKRKGEEDLIEMRDNKKRRK